MILMIDNYDSFTFNVVQYLLELGAEVTVRRNDEIDIADFLFQVVEHLVDGAFIHDITGQQNLGIQFRGEWLDPALEGIALIGKGKLGPGTMQGLGDAPGDGAIIGNAHDQTAFAGQKRLGSGIVVLVSHDGIVG